jgi:hypothetical protein
MTQPLNKSFDSAGFKYSFPGIESIKNNYAQANQDLFVLSMLGGRRNGTWLEIGCGWPLHISNTALLEFDFDWAGVSIDTYQGVLNEWIGTRNNPTTHANALFVDFVKLFKDHGITKTDIDYLSLDCDPPAQTYEILLRIPFDQYRFAVITFEHDCDSKVQQDAQEYLTQHGYKLIVKNLSDQGISWPYEDWYVHPDLVDHAKIAKHLADDNSPKDYLKYFYQNTL